MKFEKIFSKNIEPIATLTCLTDERTTSEVVTIDNLIRKALMEGYENTTIDKEKSDALLRLLFVWRKEHENYIDNVPDSTKEHGP